ncbi:DNA-binding MarR family transcriptional regulator [Mycolicibacterium iranicum]|uniref:DNA-binding MarR family transcriptional regulator n=1 Tax=Mycolicibacterium iranicum TaxID=912594 RepID=A0A839QB42_MYCIR|nr:MarR family winged helix-turn-helix transcriptional regulator [Mycolicibacterium iranicum]MBB2989761.1 DNA-binding MarR family transcriptional regulator [Mycolicibacterium iranicum]
MQARKSDAAQLADLADLVMTVARAVKMQTVSDPSVLDLSATEVTVLRYLDHHPDVSPSTVAAATGLQRSNMSRALRDLEGKGLVQRTPAPADSRQTLLRSTALAADNLARVRGIWARVLGDALDGAGDEHDVASALRLLGALERGLYR